MFLKWTLLSMITQTLLSAMSGGSGDSEEDMTGNYFEQLSRSVRSRYVMIPSITGDNKFFSAPVPYGIGNTGWTAGTVFLDLFKGKMTAKEAAGELAQVFGKELTGLPIADIDPTQDPVGWFLRTLTPTMAQPAIDAVSERDRWGNQIGKQFLDKNQYKFMQGKGTTENAYHQMAGFLYDAIGIDYSPEQVKSLFVGFIKPVADVIAGQAKFQRGDYVEGALHPVGISYFYKSGAKNPVAAKYYQTVKAGEEAIKKINRLSPYIGSGTESLEDFYLRGISAGLSESEATQAVAARKASRLLRGQDAETRKYIMMDIIRTWPK